MNYVGTEKEKAEVGDFIGSGNLADAAENVSIADSANVCFNLTGIYDGGATYTWIEGPAPSPKDFEGFVIMTPSTQRVDLVLVGGVQNWTAAKTFALTNAMTGATGEIVVNGEGVAFANKLLSLPHEDNKLTLTAYDYSTINPPTEVANTTAKVYTNAVEDATLVETPIVVRKDAAAYVVYTAEDGYIFAGGVTAITNAIDTSVNPATAEAPAAPTKQLRYVAPVYVDNIASNGIAYWTTNVVPSGFTVVASAASRVTWGTVGATSWYVVTNGTFQIDGGVDCVGDVNLVLCDGAKLTVTNVAESCAGIATDASGSFTIYETVPVDATSSSRQVGILDVTGGGFAAGIGGNFTGEGANITINGGIVTARSGAADESGAGIGGGSYADGSNITINGGTVTAMSGDLGAGIGGGYDSDGLGITINGGTVTATGGDFSAGIGGGGEGGGGERITINGGTVTATGGDGAAGIGGGSYADGSNISIRGGVVTAIGGLMSPGIGGGGGGAAENVRIANAVVFVGTVDAIIDEGEGSCRYSSELVGGGAEAGESSSGVVIDESAQVFFNLTGLWDYNNEVWIEEAVPMPETFEGFVILTSDPANVPTDGRVLVSGCDEGALNEWSFGLLNADKGDEGDIFVNGNTVAFANKLLTLTQASGDDDNKLILRASEPTVKNVDKDKSYTSVEEMVDDADPGEIAVITEPPTQTVTVSNQLIIATTDDDVTNKVDAAVGYKKSDPSTSTAGTIVVIGLETNGTVLVEREGVKVPAVETPAGTEEADWAPVTNALATVTASNATVLITPEKVKAATDEQQTSGEHPNSVAIVAEVKVKVEPKSVTMNGLSGAAKAVTEVAMDITPLLTFYSVENGTVTNVLGEAEEEMHVMPAGEELPISFDLSSIGQPPTYFLHTFTNGSTECRECYYDENDTTVASTAKRFHYDSVAQTITVAMTNFSAVVMGFSAEKPLQVGDDAWAVIGADGVCTISGKGDMWNKASWPDGKNPLASYKKSITSVVVESGVTRVGEAFFYKFYGVTNATIAASVTNVAAHAFYNCHAIKSITFQGATPDLGEQAIKYTAAIRMNGSIPEVYTIPEIESASRTIWAKTNLTDKTWINVTDKTPEKLGEYHFFKIELVK